MQIDNFKLKITCALFVVAASLPCAASTSGPAGDPSVATAPATAPSSEPINVAEYVLTGDGVLVAKLTNGLTVIIKAHRASPVVAVRCYVHTGGMYERQWLGCGLSHLLEHLVAKMERDEGNVDNHTATAEKTGRKDSSLRKTIGGQANAGTSIDVTEYRISAAASKAMDCVDLIADWMVNPDITRADFEREHGVVQRELEMGKDSPDRQFYYAHAANLYGTHPAAVPVIGLPVPLSKINYEDVLAYHKKTYVPQNMVFVVVGDVDTQAVLKRICRDFAGMQAGRVPDLSLPEVKPVASSRTVVRPMRGIKDVMEAVSFQTVPLLDKDLYALDVLSAILGEGNASRLYQNVLRDKKLVTGIRTSSDTPAWGKGDFEISFRCAPDKVATAEQAILAELKKIAADGVTKDELDRAKLGKAAELIDARQSVDSIARLLVMDYINTGDVIFSADYVKNIQAVTADQVQQAARKYFDFDRTVITRAVPQDKFATAEATTQAAAGAAATTFTLPNGLRVILEPVPGAGLVSMTFVTKGGILLETAEDNGIGSLMTALSTRGAGERTSQQIDEFFDRAGGGISGICGNNSFLWSAKVMQNDFTEGLDIFADVITKPTFSEKELNTLRPVALAGIDKVDESWQSQLNKFFRKEFYGRSPYGMIPNGSRDVVEKLTAAQLAEYHKNALKAGDSVLAIYGSFDPTVARQKIETAFASLPPGKVRLALPSARKVDSDGETHLLKTSNKVAGVMVSVPGMTVDNLADRIPMDVLDTIISGWQLPSGWLHEELRGKQLVYMVAAQNLPGLAPGAFITVAAGQPEKASEVVSIIKKNLAKAATYRPTQEEIDLAVNTILTAELLDNQSMTQLSQGAALDELYGLGYDFHHKLEQYYRKVTPDDVLRVARKYLGHGTVVTVTTPDPERLTPATKPAK